MKVIEDDTPGQFFDGLFTLSFFLQNINLAFDFIGDEMPPNRVKVIHPTGVTFLFEFISKDNHDFTGSLRGTKYGVGRISEVATVSEDLVPSTSMGLKFLRDGVDAGNMFTLHDFGGHPHTYNFLAVDYNTHVPLPKNKCNLMTSHAKLSQVSKHVGNMSVKGLSDYDELGQKEATPKWPFRCVLKPNEPEACKFGDAWPGGRGYLDQLTNGCIPAGTDLFDFQCMDRPDDMGGRLLSIGTIRTTSEMVTSLYGDTKLFYRHIRFEEDLAERPEWKDHVDMFTEPTFAQLLPLPAEAPESCPFDFMFGLM